MDLLGQGFGPFRRPLHPLVGQGFDGIEAGRGVSGVCGGYVSVMAEIRPLLPVVVRGGFGGASGRGRGMYWGRGPRQGCEGDVGVGGGRWFAEWPGIRNRSSWNGCRRLSVPVGQSDLHREVSIS